MIDTVDQIWAMKETTGVEAIIEVEVEVEKVSRMFEIFLILSIDRFKSFLKNGLEKSVI